MRARVKYLGFQTETLPPGATMKRCLTFLKARKGAARITAWASVDSARRRVPFPNA